jgi:hypothetical protein
MRAECSACGDIVPLLSFRQHVSSCEASKESAVPARLPSFAGRAPPPAAPNRSTFACPFCPRDANVKWPRAELLTHLREGARRPTDPAAAAAIVRGALPSDGALLMLGLI